jgi:glycosyltransferase involved in cell wall biosynthesis
MGEKVSICIPSYKRVHFLERLLNSISVQTYKNYEVIITDDSEDDTVSDFVKKYADVLPIFHYKNNPSLGTPRNWMAGMNKATGDWIKLIHDDDWFADENSLQEYMNAVDGKHRFIFSGYNAYYEATGRYVNKTVSQNAFQKVQNNPYLLLGDNIIGPPSVLMIHSSVKEYYDANLKWYVDIEYYMNMLHQEKAIYISAPLINMSYNDTQVTNFCFDNPAIVIPEALHILKKHGVGMVNDIMVYDSFWRSIRNMDIKNTAVLDEHKGNYPVPDFLYSIVKHQQPFSYKTLRKGYISKPLMALSYLLNKKKIVAAS